MPTFTKDVLYPGTYRLLDGRRVSYTRADVKHLTQRLKDMTAAGLQVPVAWEHQDGAKPSPAAAAKGNLGFALDAEETADGYLTAKLDIPADDDAKRLPSVRFVSPEIVNDFVDGSGRKWPGASITHIAVTPRPVQHRQKPFQPVRMSQNTVRLSLGDYQMADEKEPEEKEGEGEGEGGGDKLKKALEALTKIDLMLGDDTTLETLLDRLTVAIETKLAHEGLSDDDKEEPAADAASPVMMSLMSEVLDGKREKLKTRIKDLFKTGRINKPLRDKLTAELNTAKLSLGKDGKVVETPLAARVAAYEDLPARLSMGYGDEPSPADDPPEARKSGRPETEAEANAVLDDIDVMMGRKAAK